MCLNHCFLLRTEGNSRREEPRRLKQESVKPSTNFLLATTHLTWFTLDFVLYPQHGDVSLTRSSVHSNDYIVFYALLQHLLLVSSSRWNVILSGGGIVKHIDWWEEVAKVGCNCRTLVSESPFTEDSEKREQ